MISAKEIREVLKIVETIPVNNEQLLALDVLRNLAEDYLDHTLVEPASEEEIEKIRISGQGYNGEANLVYCSPQQLAEQLKPYDWIDLLDAYQEKLKKKYTIPQEKQQEQPQEKKIELLKLDGNTIVSNPIFVVQILRDKINELVDRINKIEENK